MKNNAAGAGSGNNGTSNPGAGKKAKNGTVREKNRLPEALPKEKQTRYLM